jgi:hypothetical protein
VTEVTTSDSTSRSGDTISILRPSAIVLVP